MQGLDELIQIVNAPNYKARYLNAKATTTCLACGRPACLFRDFPAVFEYRISGLCQDCQDKYFREIAGHNRPSARPASRSVLL